MDIVLELIDRTVGLFGTRREDRRQYYTDFVEPLRTDFDGVHNGYLESLRTYRHELQVREQVGAEHPLIKFIERDIIETKSDRYHLWQQANAITHPKFAPLFSALYEYLFADDHCAREISPDRELLNGVRQSLVHSFLTISTTTSEHELPNALSAAVDCVTRTLQNRYVAVDRNFINLKSFLLA